jgi:hypothetical protein
VQRSRYARNIYINGDPYLEGLLGLSWLPSTQAKTNASRYEAWVNATLDTLWSRFTGSRVIMAISSRQMLGRVTIRPRDASPDPTQMFDRFKSQHDLTCQAEAKPVNRKDAVIAGTPWTEEGKDYPTSTATGRGSYAVIPFNPWLFDNLTCGASVPTNRAEYVLVHELTHSLASISGKFAAYEQAPAQFDNLEEFAAIVFTNVYISETGGTKLVGGHHGEILPPELTPGKAFYDAYKEPLQRVCKNERNLVWKIREGKNISHNPFLYCEL